MPSSKEIELTSKAYEKMEVWRALPRTLLEGLDAVIKQSGTGDTSDAISAAKAPYLPKAEEETAAMYTFRSRHLTVLDPDLDEAVSHIVGTILPEPMATKFVDLGEREKDANSFWASVDNNGEHMDSFAKRLGEKAVEEAIAAIFVDVVDGADRPYFVPYKGSEIPYVKETWDPETERKVLEEVHFTGIDTQGREKRTIYRRGNPEIERGSGNAERYVSWATYYKDEEAEEENRWVLDSTDFMIPPANLTPEAERAFVEIPLFPLYSGFISSWYAKPRILKLAEMVKLKMNQESSYQAALYYSVPREIVIGMTAKEFAKHNEAESGGLKAGGGHKIHVKEGADYGFREPTGEVFTHVAAASERLQGRIDRAAYQVMSERATGSDLTATGIKASENRRVTKLAIDAALWEQGFRGATRRAGYYLGFPLEEFWSMPEPASMVDPEQAMEAAKVGLMADKIAGKTYLEIGKLVNRIPQEIDVEEALRDLAMERAGAGAGFEEVA